MGGTCDGRLTGSVNFLPGATSLLSSNNQTANIPLCQEGNVLLVVKNTSPRSDEFDFIITDYITNGVFVGTTPVVTVTDFSGNIVTGATSGLPLANIPFPPTVVDNDLIAISSVITWALDLPGSPISGTAQYDVLAERDASETSALFSRCDQDVKVIRSMCNQWGRQQMFAETHLHLLKTVNRLSQMNPSLSFPRTVTT